MGIWSSIKSVYKKADTAVGGVLPGGVTPSKSTPLPPSMKEQPSEPKWTPAVSPTTTTLPPSMRDQPSEPKWTPSAPLGSKLPGGGLVTGTRYDPSTGVTTTVLQVPAGMTGAEFMAQQRAERQRVAEEKSLLQKAADAARAAAQRIEDAARATAQKVADEARRIAELASAAKAKAEQEARELAAKIKEAELYKKVDIEVGGLLPGGLTPIEVRELEKDKDITEGRFIPSGASAAIEAERERIRALEDKTLSDRLMQVTLGFQQPIVDILTTAESVIREPEKITAFGQEIWEDPKEKIKTGYGILDVGLGGILPKGKTPEEVTYEETFGPVIKESYETIKTTAKEEPLYLAGAIATEVALMIAGGKLLQKTAQVISKTTTHLNPKLAKVITKDGKDIIKVDDVDIEIVGPGLEKISTSLEKQALLAGTDVHGVSAAQDLMSSLKGKIVVRKPIPNEAKLTPTTKTLLKKFDDEKITPKELIKLDDAIKKETGSKGLLERSFFIDPEARARVSRLGILDETQEGTLYDVLTGKASLRASKPQIILFKDLPVEKFPPKLRDIEIKLKKGTPLTEAEAIRLKNWQLTAEGKAKPIGFLGREAEVTLAPGEVFVKRGLATPTFIAGKKVKIYKADIKKATPETKLLLARSKRGDLDLKGEARLIKRLEKETGLSYSPVSKKLYYNPFKAIGSVGMLAVSTGPSILKEKISIKVAPARDTSKILSGKTTLLSAQISPQISEEITIAYRAPISFSKSTISPTVTPSKPISSRPTPSKPSSPILSPTVSSPFFKSPVSKPPAVSKPTPSPIISRPPYYPSISKTPPGSPSYSPPYSPRRGPPVRPIGPPAIKRRKQPKKIRKRVVRRGKIFQAQVRKQNKWVPYGARGPKQQVIRRTKKHLDETLRASMRVRNIKSKKFVALNPTKRYRNPKGRLKTPTILIEKRNLRLSTSSEVEDIQGYKKKRVVKRKRRKKK